VRGRGSPSADTRQCPLVHGTNQYFGWMQDSLASKMPCKWLKAFVSQLLMPSASEGSQASRALCLHWAAELHPQRNFHSLF